MLLQCQHHEILLECLQMINTRLDIICNAGKFSLLSSVPLCQLSHQTVCLPGRV